MASILVLDDRPVERELLAVVLSSAGHTVLESPNGENALALTLSKHPDLVIADVLMPGMDGYEFVRALREDPATGGTRVMLCTATYDEDEVRRLALACGVEHILIKPVEPPELLRAVAAALSEVPTPARMQPAEHFGREQQRTANAKLIEKVAALERAEEFRRLLAAIVESSEDAIIANTLDGMIMSWNDGAAKLYGFSAQEAIGKPISMLVAPDRTDEMPAIMAQIKRGEVAPRLDTVRVRKGGSTVEVAVTISPIYGEDGELTGAATIARDVSVRKQAERELTLAHRSAVETARAKTEFVTNMSHEIRTPLNGVVGMTSLLADTELDRCQREYMDALEAANTALLAVVDSVLDFSTLEAKPIELDPTRFDCRGAIAEAMLMLSAAARAKGLALSHRVEEDVPSIVEGDRTRLRQILLHLLSNAVKFTAAGEVVLHVCADESELLRFAVCDTGVGIEADSADLLFEAFAQADQSTSRRYGGTGLGLAISRELVARMGGKIGAESRDGGGARFWFTARLPAASQVDSSEPSLRLQSTVLDFEEQPLDCAEPTRARRRRTAVQSVPALAPDAPLVLLAEDNAINRTVTEALLTRRGLRTEIAEHGREAVTMAGARRYAAILMDCQMPEIDGYEATRRIREAEQGHHTPIIALTAHAMPGDRERCLGAGMDSYLAKPVRADALDAILAQWIRREPGAWEGSPTRHPYQEDPAPDSARDGGEQEPPDQACLDRTTISQLKDTLTSEMRRSLLDKFERSLSKCLSDIASAAQSRDRIELRRLAHLLKGSSASMGAAALSLGCQRLEQLSSEQDLPVGQDQLDELSATASATRPALRRELL